MTNQIDGVTLVLGCGRQDYRAIYGLTGEVITLDKEPNVHPDIVCELGLGTIPLSNDRVDFVIAHHVLEHIGFTGQTKEWFDFWEELYRIMKPNALLEFLSPYGNSIWAWADPSHVRALFPQSFIYLSQDNYRIKNSAISPFRIECDFIPYGPFKTLADPNKDIARLEPFSHFMGTLRVNKPLKAWWLDSELTNPTNSTSASEE
jgi:hypothetical protein